jgi:hypothetical protein
MNTQETLSTVLTNVQANYLNVVKAMAQADAAVADLDPDIRAAAEMLIEKYKHPQGVNAIVNSIGQLTALTATKAELEVLIATLQITLGDDDNRALEAQLKANAEVLGNPLPAAGSSGESAEADAPASEEATATVASSPVEGDPAHARFEDDGGPAPKTFSKSQVKRIKHQEQRE